MSKLYEVLAQSQQNAFLFGPLLLVLFPYTDRNWFVIGSWRLLFFLSLCPCSMCAFHFLHENKVRLKLHQGDISIFNPSEVEASCGRRRARGGRGGNIQYRETRSILDGKTTHMGKNELIEKHLPNVKHQHRHAWLSLFWRHSKAI